MEQGHKILEKRHQIAEYIARNLSGFVVAEVFAVNDTRNGYLIKE